jgi:hypothetical protein
VLSPNTIIVLTRALIKDARARRTAMFYLALAAMVMVFAGAVFFDAALRSHPFVFLGYWGLCAWITVSTALLAVFDLLAVRAAARVARRQLERKLVYKDDDPNSR